VSSKNKSIWASISLAALLIIFLSSSLGSYFYLKRKLSSEKITKVITSNIRQFLPGAKVSIDDIHLKVGGGLKVGVDNITLTDQETGKTILAIPYITLKVPLLSLVTGKGNIEFIFDKPQFFYHSANNLSNFERVFRKDLLENRKLILEEVLELPYVFKNSKISFKAHDVLIEYNLNGTKSGFMTVDEVIGKNVGFNTNMALEVIKDVKGKFSADITMITSLNISEYLRNNKITFRSLARLKNMTAPSLEARIRGLNADIETNISEEGIVTSRFVSKYEKSNLSFTTRYDSSKGLLDINNILTFVHLKDFFPGNVNVTSSIFEMKGRSKVQPHLSFMLNNYMFTFSNRRHLFNISGIVRDSLIKLSTHANFFNGELDADFKVFFKMNSPFVHFSDLISNIEGTVDLDKAKLPLDFFERKNYPTLDPKIRLPKGKVNFVVRNTTIPTGNKINGQFSVKSFFNSVAIDDLNFSIGKALVNSTNKVTILDDRLDYDIDLDISDLPVKIIKPFFLDHFNFKKGIASILLKGKYSSNYKGRYYSEDLKYDVSIQNGEVNSAYIENSVESLEKTLKSMNLLKKPLSDLLDGKFRYVTLQGSIDQDAYYVEDLKVGIRKKLNLIGNGVIYNKRNLKSKSELFLILDDKVGITQMTGEIPFLIEGTAGNLRPNYQYTMSKLLKKIIK
jgi:hypothetical protein